MNWLKLLLGISAMLVAGCAAYFSVTGLGILFSGASVAVMIMAGSLEFAKLVSATYLKQKWDDINGLNKWYLTISVVILMLITSAGIFGFLSNAFQQQNIKIQQVQREINVWETKIKSDSFQIESLTVQLNNLQSNQGKILNGGIVNNRLLKSVDNRDKQTEKLQDKINAIQDSSMIYNTKINDIKDKNINLEREIGGFRFVAESFNLPLNTVVRFFIILIVFVFDPLAVALIIAFNQLSLIKPKLNNKDDDEFKEQTIQASDLVAEISKVRLHEEDLNRLEQILLKPEKPNVIYVNEDVTPNQNEEEVIIEEPVIEEQPILQELIIEEPVTEEPIIIEEQVIEEQPILQELIIEEVVIEEQVNEEVVIEEPVIEQPVIEQPIIEEPVIEQPIIDEVVIEQPIIEEVVIEEPVIEHPIIIEDSVTKEPIIEEVVIEEPIVQEPIINNTELIITPYQQGEKKN